MIVPLVGGTSDVLEVHPVKLRELQLWPIKPILRLCHRKATYHASANGGSRDTLLFGADKVQRCPCIVHMVLSIPLVFIVFNSSL